jgi:GntR family transcriptional regulator / MocR family aminotransferase
VRSCPEYDPTGVRLRRRRAAARPVSGPVLAWDALLELGTTDDGPLHARLARALRKAMEDGALAGGSSLPSSRQLARELGCSRWVVTEAYQQLTAEGYLDPTPRSGTRVRVEAVGAVDAAPGPRRPVRFDLVPGLPDLRSFPRTRWQAAIRRASSDLPFPELGYPDHDGHPHLRDALASHLRRTRGAQVSGQTVFVTGGILDGAVRTLRAIGQGRPVRVAVEDPGWTRAREALATLATIVPIPVDDHGLRSDALRDAAVDAVLVGPAHQFPTGVVLSQERRVQLVAWAREHGGLILEDDYDAEFRYDRAPVAALQATAPDHVVLLGSVSKTLAPALGLGWLVAPPRLRPLLGEQVHPRPPTLDQLALGVLLTEGGYDRHLRELRRRYRRRRDTLLAELARELPDGEIAGAAAGLHLLLHLPAGVSAAAVVAGAPARGVRVAALDGYRSDGRATPTLVLGYANLGDDVVVEAVQRLAGLVRDLRA